MALGTLFVPNKVNVLIDLDPGLPYIPLHKDLLKQVLVNLAKNAVEAMSGSGGQLSFSTRHSTADGQQQIEIEVTDTGPGLPPAVASAPLRARRQRKGWRPRGARARDQPWPRRAHERAPQLQQHAAGNALFDSPAGAKARAAATRNQTLRVDVTRRKEDTC
jgi:hypothetical protein